MISLIVVNSCGQFIKFYMKTRDSLPIHHNKISHDYKQIISIYHTTANNNSIFHILKVSFQFLISMVKMDLTKCSVIIIWLLHNIVLIINIYRSNNYYMCSKKVCYSISDFLTFQFQATPLYTLPGVESFETFPEADPAGRLEIMQMTRILKEGILSRQTEDDPNEQRE